MASKKGKLRSLSHTSFGIGNPRTKKFFTSNGSVEVFVDSGATISMLKSSPALDEAMSKLGPIKSEKARIHTANGEKEVTRIKNLDLCLSATPKGVVCYRGDILVSDSIPGDLLIGTDFLSSQKCNINFHKRTFKCNEKKLPFKLEA